MVSFTLLTALTTLTLSALTSAASIPRSTTPTGPFYLQTQVVSGDATKDGLFFVAYHSYAGGNDVALLPNATDSPASLASLNGTYVNFDLGQGNQFPWGLFLNNLDGDSYWNEWNAVGINAGEGDSFNPGTGTGFVFGDNGLTFNVDEFDFGGWLACDWARGVPQLFWYGSFVDVSTIPSTCAAVNVLPVCV
jgi:hypothetical protein